MGIGTMIIGFPVRLILSMNTSNISPISLADRIDRLYLSDQIRRETRSSLYEKIEHASGIGHLTARGKFFRAVFASIDKTACSAMETGNSESRTDE